MSVYAIGDLHLSIGGDHSMEVFPGWERYVERIEENWHRTVKPWDTVVLVGDTSWGMGLEGALEDFKFLEALPGKKLLIKGNHDYWWTTKSKMESFFEKNGLNSLKILHNKAELCEGVALCGSRGWLAQPGGVQDEKILAREVGRMRTSLEDGAKSGLPLVALMHYPPVYENVECEPMIRLMKEYEVKQCFYGHIHYKGHHSAKQGGYEGIQWTLVSSDYRNFTPYPILYHMERENALQL